MKLDFRAILITLLISLNITSSAFSQVRFIQAIAQHPELKKLAIQVESHPNSLKANQAFIDAIEMRDPRPLLSPQYEIWMNRFPKSAQIPYAIGKEYFERGFPEAEAYLLKALKLNPNMAEAWHMLALESTVKGDRIQAIQYEEKAMHSDPKNSDYFYRYARIYSEIDKEKGDSLAREVVYGFPGSEAGADALYWLAIESNSVTQKSAYLEQLYKRYYPFKKTAGFESGMNYYYHLLLAQTPERAFDLALSMVLDKNIVNRHQWKEKIKVAESFAEAKRLLAAKQAIKAEEVIQKVKLGQFISAQEALILLKMEIADANGHTEIAYDSLALFYSKTPGDQVYAALIHYGEKLGKDSVQVAKNIQVIRDRSAIKATPFTLTSYLNGQQVSLEDFKGKVVLVSYFYPGCQPCRREFPHFESVLKKFDKNEVVYLGINVEPLQDHLVLPFVESNHYSFIPLRDNWGRDKGNLAVKEGVPENYLIDQHGRIVFSNFQIDNENERNLELMISELLNSAKTAH